MRDGQRVQGRQVLLWTSPVKDRADGRETGRHEDFETGSQREKWHCKELSE